MCAQSALSKSHNLASAIPTACVRMPWPTWLEPISKAPDYRAEAQHGAVSPRLTAGNGSATLAGLV